MTDPSEAFILAQQALARSYACLIRGDFVAMAREAAKARRRADEIEAFACDEALKKLS